MRDLIKLASTAKNKAGNPTGIIYTTTKNKKISTEKVKKKKFDKYAYNPETGKIGMHVEFVETSKVSS